MLNVIFYVKLFLMLYLCVYMVLSIRSEQKSYLFVLLFFMIMYDVRLIIINALPREIVPQLMLVAIIVYMINRVVATQASGANLFKHFIDTRQLMQSEILANTEEAIVIFRNDNLEFNAVNDAFRYYFGSGEQIIKLQDVLAHINRGEKRIFCKDLSGDNRIFYVRRVSYGKRYSILYLNDKTSQVNLERLAKEEERYFKSIWENAPNAVMIRALTGEIVYMNSSMIAFVRKPYSTLKGSPFTDIYFSRQEAYLHKELQMPLVTGKEQSFKHFFAFTHVLGDMNFLDVYESIGIYEDKRHIITTGVDATSKVYSQLLVQSYQQINQLLVSHKISPYIVLDLIYNDILFKEQVLPYLEGSLDSFTAFYRKLDEPSRRKLESLIISPDGYLGEMIAFDRDTFFVVESIFKENHGHVIGVLLKYVNTKANAYSSNVIGGMVLNHIKEGVIIIDYDGHIDYANDMMVRILNTERDLLLKKNIVDISKGLTLEMMRDNWYLSRQHESLHFERTYVTDDGEDIPVEIIAMMLTHEGTEKLVLLVRDLTEKFIYKKRLLHSQTRYAQIFDSLQDGIIEIKLPEKTVAFYRNFTEESGFIGVELTFLQWLNLIHEKDRATVYEAIDSMTIHKHRHSQVEYRYFKDGVWQWLRSTCKYMQTDQEASIIIINHNISESKELLITLQESKTLLVESEKIAKTAHWKYDISDNEFTVSETFTELTQIKAFQQKIPFDQMVEGIQWTDQGYFTEKFHQFLWERSSLNLIVRIKTEDDFIFTQFVGQMYFDDEQVPLFAIGIVVDITQRIKAEQKISESKALLENVVEQAPIGMVVIKRNGNIEMFNKEASNLLELDQGFPERLDALNAHIFKHFETIDGNDIGQELSRRMTIGASMVLKAKESPVKAIRLYVSPMHDEEKRFFGNIITVVNASTVQ